VSLLVEPYVLGLYLFVTIVLPILLLVFSGIASLYFGRTREGVNFLRGMLSSLEEGLLDIGTLLCKV
jgi:hypothetical protein